MTERKEAVRADALSVGWRVVRQGGETFVIETFGGSTVKFGPMPRDAAGPLIDKRKEYFQDTVKNFVDRPATGEGQNE